MSSGLTSRKASEIQLPSGSLLGGNTNAPPRSIRVPSEPCEASLDDLKLATGLTLGCTVLFTTLLVLGIAFSYQALVTQPVQYQSGMHANR